MRVAILGMGGMGGCHLSCYKDIEDAKLVAVCDIRKKETDERMNIVLEKTREEAGIKYYSDFDEMIKNEELDMIDICLPTYMHKEYSIRALKAGYNVLCEKPMSISLEDAAEMKEVIAKSDKLFMTAHVVRFMNPYIYLKEVIDDNKFGKLLFLDTYRYSETPTWNWEQWMLKEEYSGWSITDLLIHDIDYVQTVLGEPDKITGIYNKFKDLNDYATINFEYNNGTVVSIKGGWYNNEMPFDTGFKAIFEKGIVYCANGKLFVNGEEINISSEENKKDLGINVSNVDGYGGEIRYFMECIKEHKQPEKVTKESSYDALKLVERIKKEIKTI